MPGHVVHFSVNHFVLACVRPRLPQAACRVPLVTARRKICVAFRDTSLFSSNGRLRLLAGPPVPRARIVAAELRHVMLARRARFEQMFGRGDELAS